MDQTGHVQLLLGAPGLATPVLPASAWRLWTVTDQGFEDPAAVAGAVRLSPVAARAEKALLSAVAADDVEVLGRLAGQGGAAQDAARLLYGGRLVAVDRALAVEVLIAVLSAPADPGDLKVLRRHWPGLCVAVTLAPGVPALVPVGRVGVGLLLAEVCAAQGRPADAVAVLRQLPPQPVVVLALAAVLLAMGEHGQVLEVTARLESIEDVSALALVARSVAARTTGDLSAALDAASTALAMAEGNRSALAIALEERSRVLAQAGDDAAAQADLEALAALAAGSEQVEIPVASPLALGPDRAGATSEDDDLHRARDRMRRRIMGVGAPGTFGGRHHSTYRDDIADMFALGRIDAAEELLLGLLDAVEDEVAESGGELDPTFFLTLADLYTDSGRTDDLVALQERFKAAKERASHPRARAGPSAGERDVLPAPFDAPPPGDVDAVSIDGRPVDVDAAVEHLLVSVGVAPARQMVDRTPATAPARPPAAPIDVDVTVPRPPGPPERSEQIEVVEDQAVDEPVPPVDGPEADPESTADAEPTAPEPPAAPEDPQRQADLDALKRAARGPRIRSL